MSRSRVVDTSSTYFEPTKLRKKYSCPGSTKYGRKSPRKPKEKLGRAEPSEPGASIVQFVPVALKIYHIFTSAFSFLFSLFSCGIRRFWSGLCSRKAPFGHWKSSAVFVLFLLFLGLRSADAAEGDADAVNSTSTAIAVSVSAVAAASSVAVAESEHSEGKKTRKFMPKPPKKKRKLSRRKKSKFDLNAARNQLGLHATAGPMEVRAALSQRATTVAERSPDKAAVKRKCLQLEKQKKKLEAARQNQELEDKKCYDRRRHLETANDKLQEKIGDLKNELEEAKALH